MEEQFKKGFFEFIAAADAEKVHSQTIGWLFSENCNAFSDNDKSFILSELNKNNAKVQVTPATKVHVEINNIDIMIEGEDWIIIIENKIKSSQHSNQLFKYEYLTKHEEEEALICFLNWKSINFKDNPADAFKNLNKEFKEQFQVTKRLNKGNKKTFYWYLTLIKEKPESSNWANITYSDLYKVLDKYFKNKNNPHFENLSIVKSYIKTIGNLSRVTELFIESPSKFKFVFTEGKTIKGSYIENESDKGSAKSYIKNLGLETLLQRWFYSKLIDNLKDKNPKQFKSIEYNIGETHGTALLDFTFIDLSFKINEINYIPMIQFQGNSVKLAIAGKSEGGIKSNKDDRQIVKEYFAMRLSNNTHLHDSYKNYSTDQILKKISNPRKIDGFYSININEDNKYWQIKDEDPMSFVVTKIEQALEIFQEINA